MKAVVGCALLASAIGSRVEVTPVQKVVQLMEKMLEKGKDQKRSEQVQFVVHKKFCDDTTKEKRLKIAEAEESSVELNASVQKYTIDTALLTREIGGLDVDISVWSSDMRAATNMRDIGKLDHAATNKSYSETSDALKRAIEVLTEADYHRQLHEALLAHEGSLVRGANDTQGVGKLDHAATEKSQIHETLLAQAGTNASEITIDHESTHEVHTEPSDALPRAIEVLHKAEWHRKHSEPLLAEVMEKLIPNFAYDPEQKDKSWGLVMRKLIPDSARKAIDVFLQQGESEAEELGSIWYKLIEQGQHDAKLQSAGHHDTKFHAHDVIELLVKLSGKFTDERATLEQDEMNDRHSYTMLMQDLKAQIAQATTAKSQKSVTKSKKLQAKADATRDSKDTITTLQTDKKYVAALTKTCEQTASAFEARQQLRTDEIVAIGSAIDIISGNAVAGNAEKHLSTMPQKDSSFAQLRSTSPTGTQDRVAKYLQAQAQKLNSLVLASTAAHVSEDPYVKVKKMLKDLITRLVEEATEEAEHKGWCDSELSTNQHTRKDKTDQVETLHAEVDELQASISKLTERISDFTQAVAELDAAMAEATQLRTSDKAKNAETILDAQEAQTAVAQALTVLKEVYAKAAQSKAFVQQAEIFNTPYKGMQSETSGVVGMLEVIESDFAQLESETKAAEVSAQKDYNEFMADSKVDKSQKSVDVEHTIAKRQDETHVLTQKTQDLEGAHKELDAALAYFDKLKPSCMESGVTYGDRVSRRKDEIESLQEARRILSGSDLA